MSNFEPTGSFIIVTPKSRLEKRSRQRGGGEKYDKEEHEAFKEEVEERNLDVQIKSVASSIKSKEIRDEANLYLVAETVDETKTSKLFRSLKALSAEVHAYLDENHHKILISIPEKSLNKYETKKLPMKIKEPLLKFRELSREEQVSGTLQATWQDDMKEVVFHIMPNIGAETGKEYLSKVADFLERHNSEISWRPLPEWGLIVSKTTKEVVENLLLHSNYIFKVHEMPKPIASRLKSNKLKELRLKPMISSLNSQTPIDSTRKLPLVCVADSGISMIPPIASVVVERKSMAEFNNNDDEGKEGGHGTPIGYLVAYGDSATVPRANLISYKIYSDLNTDVDSYRGMTEAIEQYSSRAKIFVSSINFENDVLPLLAKLDNQIQKQNICFVSSAGNISSNYVKALSPSYPNYCNQFKVLHPAQNVHIIGVGAMATRANADSIAPINGISPFSRCGETLPRLYDAKKPDVVENGGNMTKETYASAGIGVSSYCKDGSYLDNLLGTSFSAPLVAGRLAEIYARFGDVLTYSEAFKAILFMSCDSRTNGNCLGFGIPRKFLQSDHEQATFISEGTVNLSDLTEPSVEHRFAKRITIFVPEGVRRIEMCLVHSDNFEETSEPSLDTYLRVEAHKEGRPSSRVPTYPNGNDAVVQSKKVYVKHLLWEYPSRDMGATWNFDIIPDSTRQIDPRLRKNVEIRFGCVIVVTRRRPEVYSLTDKVKDGMHQWEGVQHA